MPAVKSHKICDVCGWQGITVRKKCPSCWTDFPGEGQISTHTGKPVVYNQVEVDALTVVFLSREGQPLPCEVVKKTKVGRSAGAVHLKVIHLLSSEKELTNDVEDLMKKVGMDDGPPPGTYVAGIWSGHVHVPALDKKKPLFYVYEGGHTHVVT